MPRLLFWTRPFVFALLLLATLSACGQVVTKPTPMPPTLTPTVTATAPPTAQATPTPAPYTPEPTATPTLKPTPVVHTIAAGETLIAIARQYGVSVQAIQEANGITDPRTLRVGQELRIPTDPDAQLGAGTPTPEPTPLPVEISPIYFGAESSGALWGLGEVKNPGAQSLEGVRIGLQLLDDEGQVVAEGEASIALDLLEPDASSPFGVRFEQSPADFANYFVTVLHAYPAHLGGYDQAAVKPKEIFTAPILAVRKLLRRTARQPDDFDLIEINEAFAAQTLADGKALGLDWDKVNVNGGAIALGHPIGASGARVLVTLIHALRARDLRTGLATLCLGGGEAVAMSIETE